VLHAAAGFLAFSLLAGTVYLVNDLRDLESDRQHPTKRRRPIASGRLPVGVARVMLVPLLAVVAALSLWLGSGFTWVAAIYLVSQLAYTFWLKQQVLVDVFLIGSAGYALTGWVPVRPEERRAFYAEYRRWSAALAG